MYTNPPYCNSGYGICCRWISGFLKDAGHEVGISPNVAFGPGRIDISGMPFYAQGTGFSEQPTIMHYLRHGYECLLAQYDLWALNTLITLIRQHRVTFIPYVPLDHYQLHPTVAEKLTAATYIIAMCKYGLNQLTRAGFKNAIYIHHGVDTNVFKQIISKEYTPEQLRKDMGFEPDSFIIGIIKMNKGTRSGLPRQLEIIKKFIEQNPDIKTRIYLHTELNAPTGFNLETVLKILGLENITRTADQHRYYSSEYFDIHMAKMYNACDVTLSCTLSEGFGLPIIESMACGTPAIVGDYTSMTELVKPVAPELLVPPITTIWQQTPARYFLADMEKGAEALEKVANTDPSYYAKRVSEYAKKTWDWREKIAPQWIQFFNETFPKYIEDNCLKIPEASKFLKRNAKAMEITI